MDQLNKKYFVFFSFRLLLFTVFLIPVSFGGLSVNYSFILFLVMTVILKRKIVVPSKEIQFFFIIYSLLFCFATIFQVDYLNLGLRRISSFFIFMTLFAFTFIKVDKRMVIEFRSAVVMICVIKTLLTLLVFVGLDTVEFATKDEVGSQRFGFVYCLAFWIVVFFKPNQLKLSLLKSMLIGLILIGLLLTFSRSSIVALGGSVVLFSLGNLLMWLRRPTVLKIIKFGGAIAFVIISFWLMNIFFPVIIDFFNVRLIGALLDGTLSSNLSQSGTSEGIRVRILFGIFDYLSTSFIWGTGYLGIWIIPEIGAGSAHNQLADTLLRTGLIGFTVYLLLLKKIISVLYKFDQGLFWGFVGVLIYGLFHETFKEAQGAFIISFLVGMSYNTALHKKSVF